MSDNDNNGCSLHMAGCGLVALIAMSVVSTVIWITSPAEEATTNDGGTETAVEGSTLDISATFSSSSGHVSTVEVPPHEPRLDYPFPSRVQRPSTSWNAGDDGKEADVESGALYFEEIRELLPRDQATVIELLGDARRVRDADMAHVMDAPLDEALLGFEDVLKRYDDRIDSILYQYVPSWPGVVAARQSALRRFNR